MAATATRWGGAQMLLGLLAAVEAIPDLGVIYAASGRLHVLMATESARRLQSHLVHIHTQTGGRPRDVRAAARRPEVVVLRRRHAGRAPRGAALAAPREVHVFRVGVPAAAPRDAPNRILKIVAIAAAPFKRNVFLDADTVPVLRPRDALHASSRRPSSAASWTCTTSSSSTARESVPRAPSFLGVLRRARRPGSSRTPRGVIFWRAAVRTERARHRREMISGARQLICAQCVERPLRPPLARVVLPRGGDDLAHSTGATSTSSRARSCPRCSATACWSTTCYPSGVLFRVESTSEFEHAQTQCSSASVSGVERPASAHLHRRGQADRRPRALGGGGG